MNTTPSVTVTVVGGPSASVPWQQGMNAQAALESAYNQINSTAKFTYALQYYGSQFGYLVMMINETYDSFVSSSAPYFYWEFLVNGVASPTGIDGVTLNAGDVISFEFEAYNATKHALSTVAGKNESQSTSGAR